MIKPLRSEECKKHRPSNCDALDEFSSFSKGNGLYPFSPLYVIGPFA
ncbi:hypothetical protein GRAN_3515 [Granulicella sibirica]|uniref:Uncharacterized protein n=1 Tax=Granulicella sibirica TaxID=2479048 RepID=A0A4Q0T3Q4_9BACT|nr:hypothetical protein GRAN_3515 [Granulicella sibirica]